jgi:hypothetical protein
MAVVPSSGVNVIPRNCLTGDAVELVPENETRDVQVELVLALPLSVNVNNVVVKLELVLIVAVCVVA